MPSIGLSGMASNGNSNGGFFPTFARATSRLAGRPATFALVVFIVAAWALSGPVFGFSEAWQLTINTLTTIVTFLMQLRLHRKYLRLAERARSRIKGKVEDIEAKRGNRRARRR